ncbi:MAG: YeeE/YedE thiosulfate transporter family protein [Bdellovibrionota bacterium]
METSVTNWLLALGGGGLIGMAATILLLINGRIMGASGIIFGVIKPIKGDTLWKYKFLLGILLGAFSASFFIDEAFINLSNRSLISIAIAGLLVGFGTHMGNGCTSGHGVCGISRMSSRSITATFIFILTGAITTLLMSKSITLF